MSQSRSVSTGGGGGGATAALELPPPQAERNTAALQARMKVRIRLIMTAVPLVISNLLGMQYFVGFDGKYMGLGSQKSREAVQSRS